MKVSFNWLKEYISSSADLNEMVEILTNTGLEVGGVEKFETVKGGLKGLIIGEITKVEKHPNADRLSLTKVDVGDGSEKSIVCGAPNVALGQKVVVALPNTILYPINGDSFKIKKGKIRGEVSEGMICAEDEIGLGEAHDGIMVLKKKAKVGMLAKDYFKVEDDFSIDIDLTPNRTDAISHFGVARDYLAVKNLQPGFKKEKIKLPDVSAFAIDNHDLEIEVDVLDKEACPRYSGLTMTNIKVQDSPDWLKNRLKAVGLSPINNIVDAANYIMCETGQPMHVFDAQQITGDKILVKKTQQGSKFVTLDEVERELDSNDLMICNAQEPMCIAGVFGGLTSGVKNETKAIFIESAYFSPSGVRKTAKRHGLSTDASYRYERGANPDATIYALKRLAMMIKDLTGGNVSSDIVDVYPFTIDQKEVSLRWSYLSTIAGKDLLKDEVRTILSSLDVDIMTEEKEYLKLRIPGYRTDVTREIDVVEEILRIYGYNNIDIPERMHTSFSNRPAVDEDKLYNGIADLLSTLGYREIINNSLTSAKHYSDSENSVGVLNPLSIDLSVLRVSMLQGGLETIRYNLNRQAEDLLFYELGKVYRKEAKSFTEETKLSFWLTGNKWGETWRMSDRNLDLFDVKEVVHTVLKKLGINDRRISFAASNNQVISFGLDILVDKRNIGWLGAVQDTLLSTFDINKEVFSADLSWDALLAAASKEPMQFTTLPKFPSVRRDLALLIDENVEYSGIEKIAREVEKSILQRVNLFDIYKGKGVDERKKSYAVSFEFRDKQKTLTDKQVDKVMEKLIDRLKKELGAELR